MNQELITPHKYAECLTSTFHVSHKLMHLTAHTCLVDNPTHSCYGWNALLFSEWRFSVSQVAEEGLTYGVIWYRHTAHLQYIKPPLLTRKTPFIMVIF